MIAERPRISTPPPDALERWAAEMVVRERVGDFRPTMPRTILSDVDRLAIVHRLAWRRRERAIRESGIARAMPEGTYGGLLAYPNAQVVTTTSIAGTVNLWPNLIYSPIPVNGVLSPQAYRVAVTARITTAATPGNITVVPQINSVGTWITGGQAVSGGSALGSSAAIALTASITNAFYFLLGDLTIRVSGTSSTVIGHLHYVSTQGTASGLAGPAAVGAGHNLLLGGTVVTVDTQTTGQSFQLGATHTVTTITHNVDQIHMMDWN